MASCVSLAPVNSPQADPDPDRPSTHRLRASDADRERIAGVLHEAIVEGRLTIAELDERLAQTYRAATLGDLVPMVADLPGHDAALMLPTDNRLVPSGANPVTAEPGPRHIAADRMVSGPESGSAVAVFGGVERKGRWTMPRWMRVTTIFGGADLDLTDAAFAGRHMAIKTRIIFGGAQLTVPTGIAVHSNVVAIFGGTDNRATEPAPPGAPVIEITGFAVFGGLSIRHPKRKSLPPAP